MFARADQLLVEAPNSSIAALGVNAYTPRIVDTEIVSALGIANAVLIEGARGCGKTETGKFHAASEVLLDTDENALLLAGIDPKAVLEGAAPRLIDEWQLEPRLWNHVRRTVDDRQAKGQFILTGSATPNEEGPRHPGAARILRLRLRTLSLNPAETLAGYGVRSARSHDTRLPRQRTLRSLPT